MKKLLGVIKRHAVAAYYVTPEPRERSATRIRSRVAGFPSEFLSRPRVSNPEPVVYKTTALPIELGRRGFPTDSRTPCAREPLETRGCENSRPQAARTLRRVFEGSQLS
jgi:hypothetical protein